MYGGSGLCVLRDVALVARPEKNRFLVAHSADVDKNLEFFNNKFHKKEHRRGTDRQTAINIKRFLKTWDNTAKRFSWSSQCIH